VKAVSAFVAVVAILSVNATLVFMVSLLGIYGDGTAGAMPIVLGVGLTWVVGFGVAAVHLISKGDNGAGIWLSVKALPYAGLLIGVGATIWMLKGFFQ
jgi:hypothetical protein